MRDKFILALMLMPLLVISAYISIGNGVIFKLLFCAMWINMAIIAFMVIANIHISERIKIKYHYNLEHVAKIEQGDWIDLRSAEDLTLKSGESYMLSLGVSMKLPNGYEAHLAPRSSTFKNFGVIVANSYGIIDNSYSGDDDVWHLPIIAMRDTTIHFNDRICQFRIVKKQPPLKFKTVSKLHGPNRGGIGSTGVE